MVIILITTLNKSKFICIFGWNGDVLVAITTKTDPPNNENHIIILLQIVVVGYDIDTLVIITFSCPEPQHFKIN